MTKQLKNILLDHYSCRHLYRNEFYSIVTGNQLILTAPDPDTVIRSLINLERGSALQDSRIKQQFSTIPNEVWNVQAVEKITDRKRLESLLKSVDNSYDLLSQHRIRLQVSQHSTVYLFLVEFVFCTLCFMKITHFVEQGCLLLFSTGQCVLVNLLANGH